MDAQNLFEYFFPHNKILYTTVLQKIAVFTIILKI